MKQKKLSVLIAMFPYAGNSSGSSMVYEVTEWLVKLTVALKTDPKYTSRIENVAFTSFNDTPITMTRNEAVEEARKAGFDILVMVDSDMKPDMYVGDDPNAVPFFDAAFDAIYDHYEKGPLVIGAPYGGRPPHENMFVFKWSGHMNCDEETPFSLEQYSREEACRMSGIQECAALPTGLIMYDVRSFDLIDVPYFQYEWTDKTQSHKASTEDVVNTRDISLGGLAQLGYNPVMCAWDSWAGHMKVWTVGKPHLMTAENVAATLKRAFLRGEKAEQRIDFRSPIMDHLSNVEDMDHETADEHIEAVVDLLNSRGPGQRVVEIGVWTGKMSEAIIRAGHRHTAVDTFEGSETDLTGAMAATRDIYQEFKDRMAGIPDTGFARKVLVEDSLAAARATFDDWYDVVIIDADHSYDATFEDIKAWKPKVKKGGVMIGHDYMTQQFPGVDKAVEDAVLHGILDRVEPFCVSEEHGGFWLWRNE